jgi:hypothetical protein
MNIFMLGQCKSVGVMMSFNVEEVAQWTKVFDRKIIMKLPK